MRPALHSPKAIKTLLKDVLSNKPNRHHMGGEATMDGVNPTNMRSMSKTGG